ncbi:MAG: hypothetical protein IKU23_08560 [Clostridia bacterium]|nr:hypothetical protein [Clostridia bacterium]
MRALFLRPNKLLRFSFRQSTITKKDEHYGFVLLVCFIVLFVGIFYLSAGELSPIFFFWYLCIQHRHEFADQFALFLPDFFFNILVLFTFGIIHYVKDNVSSLPLVLCQNTIFLFAHGFYTYHVLRNAFEHVVALANINKLIVDAYTVNSRMLVFFIKRSFLF